jgi:hypothetical protein
MSGSAITQAEKDKAQKILNEVIKLPDNKMCADCNSLGPRWASMNLGVRCLSPPSPPPRRRSRHTRARVSCCSCECSRVRAERTVYVYEPTVRVRMQQVLVCLNCSGIHRRLGVHISKVKSITLDGWKIKWAQWMKARGAPFSKESLNQNYYA